MDNAKETTIRLAGIFGDHGILQQGMPIPVWGWAKPGAQVKANIAKVEAETQARDDGYFFLPLPPLRSGGPYDLQIKAAGKTATVKDLLLGEVWLASGQSNMQMTLNACGAQGKEAIRAAGQAKIRMITIPRVAVLAGQNDIAAEWQVANPENAPDFSAVAYHFARKLYDELKIPVGIINSSWGGTIVETWTSREALLQNPDTRHWTERYEATVFSPDFWADPRVPEASRFPVDPGNTGVKKGWAKGDFDDASWPTMELPRTWQSAGHNYSGVFWFRRSVDIPAAWAGQDLILEIGAVDKQDVTYFNGSKVGATGKDFEETHWNKPRAYKVPGRLVRPGRNAIAVRAYSFVYAGGMIGPAERMRLVRGDGKGQPISLTGAWRYQVEHNLGLVQPPAPPMGPGNPNSPYMLFDNMIRPLIPYALRGVIWYQGESNVPQWRQYQSMLTAMIRDWRRRWGQGDFPFLQVQLANYLAPQAYQENSQWARLREAQLKTLEEVNTGMAVSIDIGETADIHPKNKKDVGYRLAQWALAQTYGRKVVPSGPLYSGMTIELQRLRLHFKQVGGGLVAKGGQLRGFVVCGPARQFVEAQAAIDGATVIVEAKGVEKPIAARYAWADNPEGCNLYNAEGLPASPFRTDNFA